MTTSILKVHISRRYSHYIILYFQKIFTLYHILFSEDIHIIIHYFSKDIYIISHLISRRYSHLYIAFTLYHITFPGPLSNITITEGIHIISSCIFRRYSHYLTSRFQQIFTSTLSHTILPVDIHIISHYISRRYSNYHRTHRTLRRLMILCFCLRYRLSFIVYWVWFTLVLDTRLLNEAKTIKSNSFVQVAPNDKKFIVF